MLCPAKRLLRVAAALPLSWRFLGFDSCAAHSGLRGFRQNQAKLFVALKDQVAPAQTHDFTVAHARREGKCHNRGQIAIGGLLCGRHQALLFVLGQVAQAGIVDFGFGQATMTSSVAPPSPTRCLLKQTVR